MCLSHNGRDWAAPLAPDLENDQPISRPPDQWGVMRSDPLTVWFYDMRWPHVGHQVLSAMFHHRPMTRGDGRSFTGSAVLLLSLEGGNVIGRRQWASLIEITLLLFCTCSCGAACRNCCAAFKWHLFSIILICPFWISHRVLPSCCHTSVSKMPL